MRAIRLAVILGTIGLLAAGVACGGDSPRPVSGTASPEGVTWVLQTLDGEPVLDGTFVWLRLDGNEFEGLDGCNRYFGWHEDGTPVASVNGEFEAPPTTRTLIGCEIPEDILEQADKYIELLRQGRRFRVEGDWLAILNGEGEERLVFVRQMPLAGKPVDLAGTEWQLLVDDGAGWDGKTTTIAFVDDRLAVGTTACRGYAAFYRTSKERLGFPATSMTEYGGSSPCDEESRRQEGQFTDDLSQAIEYSVSDEQGTRRLRIRTSRGRTITFEPLAAGVESVFGVEWRLRAFVKVGQWGDPDAPLLRTDRLIPGTEVTASFRIGRGVSGFGGCNPYSARLEPEGPFAKRDGTFAKGAMVIESTTKGCPFPPGVMNQETHFTKLIGKFEGYRIYGELLVVHTNEDVVLLFHGQ